MLTFPEEPQGLTSGRIMHVTYQIVGEAQSRKVTTGVDENVCNAIDRELVRARGMATIARTIVMPGAKYRYTFADGVTLNVLVL